tara:strand:+ start:6800 stop:7462 length:663 start_codon:yes stop_codon:yes gene_type:complete
MSFKTRFTIGLLMWAALCAMGVVSVKAAPMCIPGLTGTTANFSPRAEYGTLGRHIYWWCKDPASGITYDAGFSCAHGGGCDYTKFGLLLNSFTGTTRGDKANAAYTGNVGFECADVMTEQTARGDLCRERLATYDANRATWLAGLVQPSAPVWKVKANGLLTTRPAYMLTNGVLGTKEAGRAPVGTVCDLTKPTAPATGGDVRAEFGTAGLVTICTKVIQ